MGDLETRRWRTVREKDGSIRWRAFPPYDAAEAANRLRPEERAADYATGEQIETSNDRELTALERQLLDDVNEHIVQLRDWVSRRADIIRREIGELQRGIDLRSRFDQIRANFRNKTKRIRDNFLSNHQRDLRDYALNKRRLERFRHENNLGDRAADYPDSKVLHMGIVAVALAGEGLANMNFFPRDLGLLGAFLSAAGVSLANVAISFGAGLLCLRYLNHVNPRKKILGTAGFFVAALFLISLHFSVAHYREALAREPGAEILTVLSSLRANPFGLQDMESLLLIGIGAVISVVAIWKGYTFDDEYPKYGKRFRAWKELDDHLLEEKRRFVQDVQSCKEEAEKAVLETPEILKEKERSLMRCKDEVDTQFACCNAYYEQAEQAALRLVTSFRTTVQRILQDESRFPVQKEMATQTLEPLDPREEMGGIHQLIDEKLQSVREAMTQYEREGPALVEELNEAAHALSSENELAELSREAVRRGTQANVAEGQQAS